MKIITKELATRLPSNHDLLQYKKIDPQQINSVIHILKQKQPITVYDHTNTSLYRMGKIIGVKDHINRTGSNPLIGYTKTLNIDFIDMQKIYKKNKTYIITDCCGSELNLQYSHPSHYLCNITLIARAMKYKNITAYTYTMGSQSWTKNKA